MKALKSLLGSKKFWMTIVGSIIVSSMSAAGIPYDVLVIIAGLFGTNVVSQGMADFGKNSTK